MEQAIQTLLGVLLIVMVELAVLAALVLIEYGWISQPGRPPAYWRCRSLGQSLQENVEGVAR